MTTDDDLRAEASAASAVYTGERGWRQTRDAFEAGYLEACRAHSIGSAELRAPGETPAQRWRRRQEAFRGSSAGLPPSVSRGPGDPGEGCVGAGGPAGKR